MFYFYVVKYVVFLLFIKLCFLFRLSDNTLFKRVYPYSIDLDTNTEYNLVPFMSYQISFQDFLSIFLHSLEFNSTSDKYIYIFNYKGELIAAFTFRPDLIVLGRSKNGFCDLSDDYELGVVFYSILESCDRYILDTNS